MIAAPAVREALQARLRRLPSRFSVPGSLPVLFFGDLPAATVAPVGLNPSPQEYLDPAGREFAGARRRFETLASLGAPARGALTTAQADHAVATMRAYFRPGKPVYGWFRALDRVTRGLGVAYEAGAAAHLDLVQEVTAPAWSALKLADPSEATRLLQADLPFLRWQTEAFPLRVLVCNGATVLWSTSPGRGPRARSPPAGISALFALGAPFHPARAQDANAVVLATAPDTARNVHDLDAIMALFTGAPIGADPAWRRGATIDADACS